MKILLMEDDEILNELVTSKLKNKGYDVYTTFDGEEAQTLFCEKNFDLLILDVNVPLLNGFDFLKSIRDDNINIPAIFITSLNDTLSLKKGFSLDCDDYIKKPFSFEELLLRIENIKRIYKIETDSIFSLSCDSEYNFLTSTIKINDKEVLLSKMEKKVFEYFIKNIGRTISLDELGLNIWSYDYRPTDSTIRTYIKNFRKKLGRDYILTIKGVGYRFNNV